MKKIIWFFHKEKIYLENVLHTHESEGNTVKMTKNYPWKKRVSRVHHEAVSWMLDFFNSQKVSLNHYVKANWRRIKSKSKFGRDGACLPLRQQIVRWTSTLGRLAFSQAITNQNAHAHNISGWVASLIFTKYLQASQRWFCEQSCHFKVINIV